MPGTIPETNGESKMVLSNLRNLQRHWKHKIAMNVLNSRSVTFLEDKKMYKKRLDEVTLVMNKYKQGKKQTKHWHNTIMTWVTEYRFKKKYGK